mgnify:CR=1 FL=1
MSPAVLLHCCCDATVSATLSREFRPIFHGGDSGLGRWELRLDVPDGWVAFDPYTNVTYCPTCWADIETPEPSGAGTPEAGQSNPPAGLPETRNE